jgi:S-adenosylmethionine synthetase
MIGGIHPISLMVNCHGTETVDEKRLIPMIHELFDLSPSGIIEDLDLLRPIYKNCAAYGHFGGDQTLYPWERVDRVEAIKSSLNI